MPNHPQTTIEHEGYSAEVDEEIASLLLNLWRLEIWTTLSCQDNRGKVWIEFETPSGAEHFLTIVAGGFEDDANSFYNRVAGEFVPDDPNSGWDYRASVHDDHTEWSEDQTELTSIGPPLLRMSVSVRFPPSDLPEVEARIAASLDGDLGPPATDF